MAHSFLSDRCRTGLRSGSAEARGRKAAPDARVALAQALAAESGPVRALQAMTDRAAAVQRAGGPDEEEPLQGKAFPRAGDNEPLQGKRQAPGEAGPQRGGASGGGLPEGLRGGIEELSGQSMADVRVHRNSSAPAAVGAHAFAQGQDIHLAPGQDKHLPHEAWHVVQQKQGRVAPTIEVAGVPVNDSPALESEADRMGAEAARKGD